MEVASARTRANQVDTGQQLPVISMLASVTWVKRQRGMQTNDVIPDHTGQYRALILHVKFNLSNSSGYQA